MSANEMICRLFQARTAAHMAHFQTRSYAQHVALNEFYDGIVEAADSFAENYQGIFGIMEEYPPCPLPTGKPVDWIQVLYEWLKKNRSACCKGETVLENLYDETIAVCTKTLYKLKFLDSGTHSEPDADDMGMMSMSKW